MTNSQTPGTTKLLRGALVWGHGAVDLLIKGNRIEEIGTGIDAPPGCEIKNFRDCVIYPGLVNTHHHLKQSILKGMPGAINADLNHWLGEVPYKAWPHLTPDILYTAARIGLYELLRSGSTTCADHHYVYQANTDPELEQAIFRAADEMGVRLVLCRGGATTRGTHPGLNAAGIEPESIDQFLSRLADTVSRHHDPSPDSMTRVAAAPTTLIHATPAEHLKEISAFARDKGLKMHSHLLEVDYEIEVCQAREGMSPVDYAESVGWLGEDVWYAHIVHADDAAIAKLGATRTGLAHCPNSNFRLGSGIARVPEMIEAGVRVSLAVDGSAAAESASMTDEMMLAWLAHRGVGGPNATEVEQVVSWATEGGAEILGFEELGRIEPQQIADLAIFSLDDPRFYGLWEPIWAPVICGEPVEAEAVMVNGNWVVEQGRVLGLDMDQLRIDAKRDLQILKEKCL